MKKVLVPFIIVLLVLIGAYFVYKFLFGKDMITVAEGSVEIESGGVWIPVLAGGKISKNAKIRVVGEKGAVLALADGVNLEVKKGSELTVEDIGKKGATLKLASGEVKTEIREDIKDVSLTIKSAGRSLKATSGSLVLSSDGKETFTLASLRGGARFIMDNIEFTLKEKEKTIFSGKGKIIKVKKEKPLELSVKWPPEKINFTDLTLEGKTEPGVRIVTDGKIVYAGADGTFSIDITLKEGKNEVVLVARDVLERERVEKREIEVDTTLPDIYIEKKSLWK